MNTITQELIGRLANNKRDFRIALGSCTWRTKYDWAHCHLTEQTIVGFVVDFDGKPLVSLIDICEVNFSSFPGEVRSVVGTPYLHLEDIRKIADLPVSEFTLTPNEIAFVLERET